MLHRLTDEAGQPMPGLFVVDRQPVLSRRILDDLEAMAAASEMDDWHDRVVFAPL
jgi:hypothetical protein